MTQISSTFKSTLLSPRTADYLAALSREGDNFDYSKWLQRVREEETQTKQGPPTNTEQIVPGKIDVQVSKSIRPEAPPNGRIFNGRVLIWKGIRRLHRTAPGSTSGTPITRRLNDIRDAWVEFQASRARDAVYGYLSAVFETVMHYKVRRKTKKLLRYASKFADLPFDKNADPFTTVIRCTSVGAVDSKTISKLARALRYVARCKVRPTQLKMFMKEAGGINACASLYAERALR